MATSSHHSAAGLHRRDPHGAGHDVASRASAPPAAGTSTAPAPIVVTHRVPSSARPQTTSGTTSVGAAHDERRKGRAPKATGPQPGQADLVVDGDAGEGLVDLGDGRPQGDAPTGQPDPPALEQHAVGPGAGEQVDVAVEPAGRGGEVSHAVPTSSWLMPPDSRRRSASGKPAPAIDAARAPGGGGR